LPDKARSRLTVKADDWGIEQTLPEGLQIPPREASDHQQA
jgi:hypothetical protein